MKHICILLLILIFSFSSHSQIANTYPSEAEVQAAADRGIDPYFVESSDTFSLDGPSCIVRHITQDRKYMACELAGDY